jgi:archaellum component FlaC
MMNDLTYRLRNGFGSICGRASQVDGYQTISNEAADKIDELELHLRQTLDNAMSQASDLRDRIAGLEKERDELKTQLDVLTFENETNHECYVNLLFSNKPTEVNLQTHNLEQQVKGVENLKFPSMLRKMWSGGEVQEWLDNEGRALKEQDNG